MKPDIESRTKLQTAYTAALYLQSYFLSEYDEELDVALIKVLHTDIDDILEKLCNKLGEKLNDQGN